MKKFFLAIFHFLQNVFLFFLGLFFSFIPDRKPVKPKKGEEKKSKIANFSKEIPKEESSDSSSRERFQEYLRAKTLSQELLEEKIETYIEKSYDIKIKELSLECQKKAKVYEEKILKKLEEKRENSWEEEHINHFLREKIEQDKKEFMEKEKKKNQTSHIKLEQEEIPKRIEPRQEFLQVKSIPLSLKQEEILSKKEEIPPIRIEENLGVGKENIHFREKEEKLSTEQPIELTIPIIKNEKQEELQETNVKRIEAQAELEELNLERKEESQLEVKNPVEQKVSTESIIFFPKENFQEHLIPGLERKEENPPKQIDFYEKKEEVEETKKEEPMRHPEKQEEKLQDKKEEKKKAEEKKPEKTLEIFLNEIRRETSKANEIANSEIKKEEFVDKDYEKVEKLIHIKIEKLENILQKPLQQETKEEVEKEIVKLKQLEKKVKFQKEEDLESIRCSLEESISEEEKDLLKQKIEEFQKEKELERFDLLQNKTKEEIENIDKEFVKETICEINRNLKISLFLSLPFIKNKYFRRFVSGVFVFSSFSFLKQILFGTKQEQIDLSAIKEGKDALTESSILLEKNIHTLRVLKQNIFLKYPELKQDPEFLYSLHQIERNLEKNQEKVLKQEKVVNKYFRKAQVLERRRKW